MTNERLTLQEIEQKYPDAWLLIVDCEISENTELLILYYPLAGEVSQPRLTPQTVGAVS